MYLRRTGKVRELGTNDKGVRVHAFVLAQPDFNQRRSSIQNSRLARRVTVWLKVVAGGLGSPQTYVKPNTDELAPRSCSRISTRCSRKFVDVTCHLLAIC